MRLLDWFIVSFYFLFLAYIVFKNRYKEAPDETEYLLSGRKLTLPAFIATLVSTWYGGILGVGEFTYQFGISQWVIMTFPYYLFALLYAWFLAPRIRERAFLTIPDGFQQIYGKRSGQISAIAVFLLVNPAPYIFMIGLLAGYLFGSEQTVLWAVIVALFSGIYVSSGGFDAVVRTDKLQIVLMYFGFGVLLLAAIITHGSIGKLFSELPDEMLNLTGGHSLQYIVVWFFIALWTFVDPGFFQRVSAAKSPETAKHGIILSVGFWALFDLLSILTALFGANLLQLDEPALVYPLLSEALLPVGLHGLFIVALLATIMSTLDSFLFLAGQTLGRDFLYDFYPNYSSVTLIKISIAVSLFISIVLIIFFPSVIQLWYVIGSIVIPVLLLPVLGLFFTLFRLQNREELPMMMILSALTGTFWLMSGYYTSEEAYSFAWLGIEPFYPALLMSLIFWIIRREKYSQKENQ